MLCLVHDLPYLMNTLPRAEGSGSKSSFVIRTLGHRTGGLKPAVWSAVCGHCGPMLTVIVTAAVFYHGLPCWGAIDIYLSLYLSNRDNTVDFGFDLNDIFSECIKFDLN